MLLPRRDDIVDLRERLQRLRIPCVGAGRNDVFASIWANELRVVLHALADPTDAGAESEHEDIAAILRGSGPDFAEKGGVSIGTVRVHIRNIYEKLQVNSRHEAVKKVFPGA